MNKGKMVVLMAAMLVASGALAADEMNSQPEMMDMKAMDANHDGMVSKQEFMKYHEDMWAKMQKTKSGMVDMKDMGRMNGGAMNKDGSMMKDGSMPKDGSMAKDGSMPKDGSMAKDGSMPKDGSMMKDGSMGKEKAGK